MPIGMLRRFYKTYYKGSIERIQKASKELLDGQEARNKDIYIGKNGLDLFLGYNPKKGDFHNEYIICLKKSWVIQIFTSLGFRSKLLRMTLDLYERSTKNHFTDLAYKSSLELSTTYAFVKGDISKASQFRSAAERHFKTVELEQRSLFLFLSIIEFEQSNNKDLLAQIHKEYLELSKHVNKVGSFKFHHDLSDVTIRLGSAFYTKEEVKSKVLKVLEWFDDQEYNHLEAKLKLIDDLIEVHLDQAEYVKAEPLLHRYNLMVENSSDYRKIRGLELLLNVELKQEKYTEAWLTLVKLKSHKSFHTTTELLQDRVSFYELYLKLLGMMGLINNVHPTEKEIRKLLVKYNLKYRKDKKGYNIALQLATLIFQIILRDESGVRISHTSLHRYFWRNLNDDQHASIKAFSKWLYLTGTKDGDLSKNKSKREEQVEKVKNNPLRISSWSGKVEVVGYLKIMDHINEYLKT